MLKRSLSIVCLSAVGTFAPLLASCGSGETPAATPEETPKDPTPATSSDAESAITDASVTTLQDTAGSSSASDASTAPIPVTAEALATVTALRARFALKVPADMPDRDPSDDSADPTGNDALAAPATRPALDVGLVHEFDVNAEGLVIPHFVSGSQVARPARVALSRKASSPFRIEDAAAGMSVEVTLRDSRDVEVEAAEGYLVYRGGHASGATLLHRALPDGTEDFLSFDAPPLATEVVYQLTLRKGVAGLRLVANTLEMLDAKGAPRLRVSPPSLVTADGAEIEATLAIDDCAYDDDPASPWDRPVLEPGGDTCAVRLKWPAEGITYPALLDPKWSTTGSMSVARQDHAATVLSNGKVLVSGGTNGTTTYASAELYDRTTGAWAATGSMTGARKLHTATQFGTSSNSTTSGKVLVAGGLNGTTTLNTAQLYSVTAGTWTAAANLNVARKEHSATLLANGKVLVAGGSSGSTTLNTAALYNPASGTGSWAATGNMATARKFHSATLLATSNATLNNKVLVVGGNSGTASLTSVQLFDGTSSWSTLTALSSAREQHTATLLANGKLLVAGGRNGSATLNTSFVFNPASGSGSWTSGGTMKSARHGHTATLLSSAVLNDGQVVVVGGWDGSTVLSSAELFTEPSTWVLTTPLPAAGKYQTASLLSNGMVLVAGGVNAGLNAVGTAVLYDPSRGKSCTTTTQCATGFCANGVCCDTACTGECGACNLTGLAGTCSPKANGTACTDDGNACTTDKCNGSSLTCQHSAGNAGTICRASTGTCDPAETCSGVSASCPGDLKAPNGTSCSDGNACTTADLCANGTCVGGPPLGVDDGKPCTTDSCDPATGAVHTPLSAGTACPDGNLCNGNEVCDNTGACLPGTPPVLDDGNPCTADSCTPTGGPQHDPLPVGASCSDGNLCNGVEICAAGSICMPGIPPIIDDGKACTVDMCDPVLGPIHTNLPAGTDCADGVICTAATCDGNGGCVGCVSCTNGVRDGNETSVDCGGSCPACPTGGGCTTDSDCAAGLSCGTNNGACFGPAPRGSNVCWPSSCQAGGNKAACGAADSACGSNCDCVTPCDPTDAGSTCPTGEVCKPRMGGLFYASVADVCVDPRCPSNDPTLCGAADALCGQICVCTPNCSSATCANPADGCGGICPGVCPPGATGCTEDATCPPEFACIPGDEGKRTCRPGSCSGKVLVPPLCGVPGAPCGDQCPTCQKECGGRTCGTDLKCGVSCGSCDNGMYCSAAGSCVTPTGSTPVGVPDGQGGSHPVVVPPAPPPSHIGALNGMFSVSEQGTSEYTVPIDVPPGRAGMQPVLSLKYAGSKTNGDLGMGWHLDGLSTITRCPAINALDKGARPVEGLSGGPIQTTGDHFCIDGKRLETVAGVGGGAPGNYGADGTEYRTLIDSFARIVSNQDASDIQPDPDPNVIMLPPSLEGPDSFHVWTKDGKILTYGGTRDSLVMKRDGARSTWLLRRVEDRAGNTMTIGYRNVPAALSARFNGGNAVRPDVISYTGHGDDPGNREVKFMYENRADPQLMFLQGGVPMMAEQRLMRIVTYLKGKAVKNYHIGYEEVAGVATSQISTISECTEDGDTHCKNPTKFDYEDDSGFTLCDAEDKKTCSGPSITDSAGKLDANGDGIPDYLLMKAIQHPVDPSPWLTVAQIAADVALAVATSGASTAVQIGASAVWAQASPSIWALFAKSPDVEIKSTMYLGTGDRTLPTRFNGSVSGIPCPGASHPTWILDYDRDGLDDIVVGCPGGGMFNLSIGHSLGNGNFRDDGVVASVPIQGCHNPNCIENQKAETPVTLPRAIFIDVNGDSLEDLLYCKDRRNLSLQLQTGPGAGFGNPIPVTAGFFCEGTQSPTYAILDVDGDGNADLLTGDTNGWDVLRFTPPSFASWQVVDLKSIGNLTTGDAVSFGDFNGDGLVDIFRPANDVAVIWLNGGDKHFSAHQVYWPRPALDRHDDFGPFSLQKQAVVDQNGDGRADFLESWLAVSGANAHFYNVGLLPNSSVYSVNAVDAQLLWPREGDIDPDQLVQGGFRLAADLDGDGNVDLFGNKKPFYGKGSRNRLLNRVVDGAGRLTRIKYDSNFPSATYENTGSSTCASTWPDTCLKRMSGLVSSYDEGFVYPGGDTVERSYEHHYFNAHMSVTGEGWLGFERRITRSFVSGDLMQEVTTEYELPHPYTPDGQSIPNGVPLVPPYVYPLAGMANRITVDNYPRTPSINTDPAGHIENGSFIRRQRTDSIWSVRRSAFGRAFPFAQVRMTRTFDRALSVPPLPFGDDGTLLTDCRQELDSDAYGNVISAVDKCQSDEEEGFVETTQTTTEIAPEPTTWLIANPNHITKTSIRNGESATEEWTLGYLNGLLRTTTRAPESRPQQYTTTYLRDEFNVRIILEEVITGEPARATVINYDQDNIFPESIVNPKNQTTQLRFDGRWGAPSINADPNGIATVSVYDDFGRLVTSIGPAGTAVATYADAKNAPPGFVQHPQVTFESQGTEGTRAGTEVREFDHHGQLVKSTTDSLAGAKVFEERTYDDLGRIVTRTLPHANDAITPPTERYSYDRLHHVKRIDHPDNTFREFQYASSATLDPQYNQWLSGMQCNGSSLHWCYVDLVRSVDEEGRMNVVVLDHRGMITRSIDGNNLATTDQSSNYAYGPFNRLRLAYDNQGHTMESVYDDYGRRTSFVDPDTGPSGSVYNGYDELIQTTDPKNQTRVYHYDLLSRIQSIDDPSGTTQWIYDQGTNAVGRLSETISPPTPENPSGNHVAYNYEPTSASAARGFLQRIDTTIDGTVYSVTQDYDDLGRTDRIHYPNLGTGAPIVAKYHYDPSGILTGVDEVGSNATRPIWQLDSAFEGSLVGHETFGNGAATEYHYNSQRRWLDSIQTTLSTSVIRTINQGHFNNGLLRTRSSLTRQREYTYDDLNRLKSSTEILPGSTPQTTLYDYDPLGNITTRGNTTLTYHDTQPHLLEMAGDNTYGYDANGNVGTRVGPDVPGGGQTFEYTPFDLPRSISTGSGAAARTTQFEYTASQTRAVRRDSDTTRYFVGGGLYQRMVTTGTSDTREERFSLNAAGRQLGEIVRKGGADETLFFHADNQGTVDTITTDSQVTYTQDFDPFGAPIDPPDPAVTRSGFTGHQHDNDLGLIDMRGRMYDTFAARFTSADPVLLARFSSQDFNRYSYVSNDPVNNVDPTGYSGMGIYDSYAGMAGCLRMGYGCGGGSAAAAGGEGLSGGPSNGILGIPGTPLGQGILQAGFNVALDLLVNGPAGAGQAGRTWNEPAPSGAPRATGTGVGGMNAVGQNRGGVGPQSAGGSSSPSGLSGGSPLDQSRDAFRHVAELTGNVGTQMIGKVPVAVFGGTAVERDSAITAAMNVLMLSDTGRKMGAELASRRNWLGFGEVKALEIVLVNSGGSYTYPNSQIIAIDLNDIGRAYNSLRPGGVYSYERVLAHELGHAAFGDRDIGIDRMFNVEWNENWVMNELGDTNDRLTYP